MMRLIAIPVLAVAGVLIYRGVQDRFVLPECDSGRATDTLASVLKGLDSAPLRYEPIKTISKTDKEVVCNAALPLSDGATLNIDYRFFWQGSAAQMKYSISRKEPKASGESVPHSEQSGRPQSELNVTDNPSRGNGIGHIRHSGR